jgi:hypothetical protein
MKAGGQCKEAVAHQREDIVLATGIKVIAADHQRRHDQAQPHKIQRGQVAGVAGQRELLRHFVQITRRHETAQKAEQALEDRGCHPLAQGAFPVGRLRRHRAIHIAVQPLDHCALGPRRRQRHPDRPGGRHGQHGKNQRCEWACNCIVHATP